MNPLTNVKNITKLNEKELSLGLNSRTSWHNLYKNSAWVFIGGLPYDLTEGDIVCVFSQYGEVVNLNLIRDKKSGKSKGFCFLCYEDQRSTVLAVDNFNGIKLCGRTVRVDHVENYKIPKEHEDDDALTKTIHLEGCAPKSPEHHLDEKNIPKLKKEKKKKKERVKKSSDTGASSSDVSAKEIKPLVKVKEEKADSSYNRYLSKDLTSTNCFRNSSQKQKLQNQFEDSVQSINIQVKLKLPSARGLDVDPDHSSKFRHRSRSPLPVPQNSLRSSVSSKDRHKSPSSERRYFTKTGTFLSKSKNGREKLEEKSLPKRRSWNKERYHKSHDQQKIDTSMDKNYISRSHKGNRKVNEHNWREEYIVEKRPRENDLYEKERSSDRDFKRSKRKEHRSWLSPLSYRFDEHQEGRRAYEISYTENDKRRYKEHQYDQDNGDSRFSEHMYDTEDFTDRRRDWEIGKSYTEREKELEWLRKREIEIERERARESYEFQEEFNRDFECDRRYYDNFSDVPRDRFNDRTDVRFKQRSRKWNEKNIKRQSRTSQR
ncbi:RNA-binding motif protein, X-linked 2-like [Limulus polyphemus]|uniref:RNA-binding motif protein, X-linked 2-like n=1 Tax=Limulus polyphemus TaxID=6850 RepID=A0ABM1BYR4_LIMPO|nr:RNA-binding motif protein, X-linked 2-like [Limulus polyphemus]